LVIAGDGSELDNLKTFVNQNKLENFVKFLGKIPHDEIPYLIKKSHICLSPFTKNAFNGTGSSALKNYEYLACDKPIIASKGEDHNFIEDYKLGLLALADDVDDWKKKILTFMERPFTLNGKGVSFVQEKHDDRNMFYNILKICDLSN